ERFIMGLARPCKRKAGVAYVVEQLIEEVDYLHCSGGGLALTDAMSSQMNLLSVKAAKAHLVPVHLHSHPPAVADFSHGDDVHERRLHEWLTQHGQRFLWSLV